MLSLFWISFYRPRYKSLLKQLESICMKFIAKIIFSTEATGRIGYRAKSFLDKLLPASSSNSPRYKSLLKQLESICMKFNAQMIYKRLCSTSHISDPTQKLLQTTAHSSIM